MGQDQPLAVLSDVVFSGRSLPIPVAKQSINPDDFKIWADQMEMESTVSPPVSGAANGSAWENVNDYQRFSGWVASNLVSGAIFKIKMTLLSSLFQLLFGCIELKSVSQDAVKLFCVEFASQESLNGAIVMPPDFEYLNHQIHIWIAAHQLTKTSLETEKESYQTAPVFDLFSSKLEHSTQTVTPEPMTQDSLQQNILIVLQSIQTALGQRNNTPLPLFRGNAQDLIEWLDDFKRAATANQYDNKYKFQIISGYLQGSSVTWFSQETNANVQQRIIR
ncbi:hypothetical protein G9A89_005040 [Geosiphon pyriformis]|nr:hypothetical protein G9A89_005040 [Geosiphon pyriformis]